MRSYGMHLGTFPSLPAIPNHLPDIPRPLRYSWVKREGTRGDSYVSNKSDTVRKVMRQWT